jgi:hypothetical protein
MVKPSMVIGYFRAVLTRYTFLKDKTAKTTGVQLFRTVVPLFAPFYARFIDYGIKPMENQTIWVLDYEGYRTFLEELLNLEGQTELGRGRRSAMAVS